MIEGANPVLQALLGTLLTWGLTAAGAACVILVIGYQRKILDGSLGFAAGVMIAASFWSLLTPAIDLAKETYGGDKNFACMHVAFGYLFGAAFVFMADRFLSCMGISSPENMIPMNKSSNEPEKEKDPESMEGFNNNTYEIQQPSLSEAEVKANAHWKRILLLVIGIAIHNIPEGLAVGVTFGAIGNSEAATFENARNLAIGIGIQNFPEGLAVSLPLHAAGFSMLKSFWYGQLSGMVEPIFGVLGAFAVSVARLILPYALSFAAGAMMYIVVDDIIPEAHASGNGKIATWGATVGFLIMMVLEVTLG